MSIKKPWDFNAELSEDRLEIIGNLISDIYNTSAEEHRQHGDTSYVIGTVCFGRTYQALLSLKDYDWYQVTRTTFDIVFEIGRVPCRFFSTTDPNNPKAKVYNRNQQDSLFPETEEEPCLWRFLIQKPISEEFDQYEIFFVGFDIHHNIRAQWCLSDKEKILNNLDHVLDIAEMEKPFSKSSVLPEAPVSRKADKKKSDG
ncbi:MAG: hypothetical protein Q4D78_04335 [Neisseria zoodegmatis]|uniref:hypothetical protein n=1 Tax=Neisseria zoodegmatis TaxID=326523 RepID=UPI0026EAEE4D|nr:hypothetical protein [Neisseria zoodegmatis]MDO5069415.1 hypothetical protein [Neisseria zoodegmatis]